MNGLKKSKCGKTNIPLPFSHNLSRFFGKNPSPSKQQAHHFQQKTLNLLQRDPNLLELVPEPSGIKLFVLQMKSTVAKTVPNLLQIESTVVKTVPNLLKIVPNLWKIESTVEKSYLNLPEIVQHLLKIVSNTP